LPSHRFDACISTGVKVDKYQTARFDNVLYSVPRQQAFHSVTVKAYVDRIEIVAAGVVIARHVRCYEPGRQILDPLHYLTTLSRKPGCLDHSPLYRDWHLPSSFTELRNTLENQHGPHAGSRQFIRILQLLREHPVERISRVIEPFVSGQPVTADLIISRVQRLRGEDRPTPLSDHESTLPPSVPVVQVPLPDLRRFNEFLSFGDKTDVEFTPVTQDQPQAIETADHVCRV